MKIISALLIFLFAAEGFSQDKPSVSISLGFTFPSGNMSGDLTYVNDSGYTFIDSNFIKNNYAAKTGAGVTGSLKFPLHKKGIFNGVLSGSYYNFTSFSSSTFGTSQIRTTSGSIRVPVTYEQKFTSTSFGIGIDITPFPNEKLTPFINPNVNLNLFSLSIDRVENQFFHRINFNDIFRIGASLNAGVMYRYNDEYSFTISSTYNMGNLFLKGVSSSFSERLDDNTFSGLPFNDAEGEFYSNLPDPNALAKLYQGSEKKLNWLSIMLGLNIKLGK